MPLEQVASLPGATYARGTDFDAGRSKLVGDELGSLGGVFDANPPLSELVLDRVWRQVEWPGMTPNCTVMPTLAAAAMSTSRWRRWWMPPPLLGGVLGSAT